MKNGLEMIDDAYQVLNVPDITSIITGNLYKLTRPKNSVLEDIVINGLPITNTQLQQGTFNVNIHVPNLTDVKIGDVYDETQPDIVRLNAISKIIVEKLADVVGNDYRFSAQNSGYPIRDTDLTWYMNIRVDYYAAQMNFNNI
jgi:hypothetical protein